MKVHIRMVIEDDDGHSQSVDDVAFWERSELTPGSLGLTLAEAKNLLKRIQHHTVMHQVAEHLNREQDCPVCKRPRSVKGRHRLVMRTVFGRLSLPSARLRRCPCETQTTQSFSPLAAVLPERTAPELLYLQSKWASLMSYGMTVNLLSDVLPMDAQLNVATVYRKVHHIAQRLDDALGDEVGVTSAQYNNPDPLPRPGTPLTVGIDGGYVHAREKTNRKAGWFEVIAGKSLTDDARPKCFAFVHRYDKKSRRRLDATLASQGFQPHQGLTFVSDGGETVRALQYHISPHAEHILDWFHVTMRLTVMNQMAKGLSAAELPELANDTAKELERVKWYSWHGNVYQALQRIDMASGSAECADDEALGKKLCQALDEFSTYISNNRANIPNYGDRYHHGERIASGFVESTVNQVISKRFVKKQQMRWTQRGAHLLLQTRTATLNDDLRSSFEQWYPEMKAAV